MTAPTGTLSPTTSAASPATSTSSRNGPTSTASDPGVRAAATLLTAFSTDPVVRWFWPDPASYLGEFATLLDLHGIHGTDAVVDLVADDLGAALWFPPGIDIDQDSVGEQVLASFPSTRQGEVVAFLEQMATMHPRETHWYLPFMGVDPTSQGQGHGSTLLEEGLSRCDRDELPAYLEASSPGSRRLYERFGFEVLGEIQAADSPPAWPMLRAPARGRGNA